MGTTKFTGKNSDDPETVSQGETAGNENDKPEANDKRGRRGDTGRRSRIDTKYSARELANAARVRFEVPPEVVLTALKIADITEAGIDEAKGIIKAFLERKVR